MGADVEMKDGADKDEKKTAKEETPVAPQDVLDVVRASQSSDVGSVHNRFGAPGSGFARTDRALSRDAAAGR